MVVEEGVLNSVCLRFLSRLCIISKNGKRL